MGKALEMLGNLGKTVAKQLFIGTGIPLVAGIAKRAILARPGTVALAVGGAAVGAAGIGVALTLPAIAATAALGALGYLGYVLASWLLGKVARGLATYKEFSGRRSRVDGFPTRFPWRSPRS